jgi:hypothetical protein
VAKLKSVTKFFRPSSRYRISIDAINVVVRIYVFFVFVCRSVSKEGKIVIYSIKFVVSVSSLVTALDTLGQYLLSHFYFFLNLVNFEEYVYYRLLSCLGFFHITSCLKILRSSSELFTYHYI